MTAIYRPYSAHSPLFGHLAYHRNMMTLLALLALVLGFLRFDDAIVVRNIVRHADMGKDHVTARLMAPKKLAWRF